MEYLNKDKVINGEMTQNEHEDNLETNNNQQMSQAKIEKVTLDDIEKEKSNELVKRIMDKILKIK